MKRIQTVIIVFAFPALLSAQVDVTNSSVVKNRWNVDVSFTVDTDADAVKSRYKMILTPYLYNGEDTVYLPETEIYGKIRYKRERQEQALDGNPDWQLGPNQYRKGDECIYKATVPYEKWMRTASLGIHRQLVGCGCDCYDGYQDVQNDIPVYVAPNPVVAEAPADPAKYEVVDPHKRWAFDKEELTVYFPVSKTRLLLDKYGNQETLDKIIAGIRKIGDAEKMRLSGVEITGFASPEGTLKFNTELGEGRANALKKYIQDEVSELRNDDFNLINGVENWDGLREMIAESDLETRDKMLEIIDNTSGEARKNELKRLDGGKSYAYILRNFYPVLRNACYIAVYYDVLDDKAATAINQANVAIREHRYADALEMLLPYKEDSRSWNSIGVCYMMLEEEDTAIDWFRKAKDAGDPVAVENLKQIE